MSEKCTHYACRCARATELAEMSDRQGRPSLMIEAINVHDDEVPCRQVKDGRSYQRPLQDSSQER